ncbi:MAG: thiamine-phosphate kinase [bacterium]|jgi:thiamine-monophosphate kinase|nr:thiamine-phosphate kinase [candidate division KSB1 bacterium]MDH7561180.1 thiamine-phosphate kinase [bacterium]
MRIAEIGEFGLIARLKALCGQPPAAVVVGIDDDAAAFRHSGDELLVVTTDALVEGVHFRWDYFTPYQLGWRSMAANISDIAAMAAEPRYAVVSVALPAAMSVEEVEGLYQGMVDLAARSGASIIGGDTTRSPGGLFLSITVCGSVPPRSIARRDGARAGDGLYVTGFLGQAHAGLLALSSPALLPKERFPAAVGRHLQPLPRVQEALFLRDNLHLTSMIDVSDGLASEVHHLCRLSGVGAVVEEAAIPLSAEAREIAACLRQEASEFALNGGEDFELLFTAADTEVQAVRRSFEEEFGLSFTKVGEMVPAEQGVLLRQKDGRLRPLAMSGWNHFGRTGGRAAQEATDGRP